MAIDRDDIVRLLKGAQTYDNRIIDDEMTDAWGLAARLARWSAAEAAFAIAVHYAENTDRIMPGHVTRIIRSRRPGKPTPTELAADPRGITRGPGGSSAEHRASLRAEVAAKLETQLEGRRPRKAREPWHDGPVERPQRAIDPKRVRALARTVEGAASSLAARFDATGS